jgi:hypothetical protein
LFVIHILQDKIYANFRFENFEIQVANSNCLYWHNFRSISLPSFALLIVYFSSIMCQCLHKRFALMEVLTFAHIHLWNKSIFIQGYHNWSSNQIIYVIIRYIFLPKKEEFIHKLTFFVVCCLRFLQPQSTHSKNWVPVHIHFIRSEGDAKFGHAPS